MQARDFALAETLLTNALEISPSDAHAQADLAQLYFETNRAEEAILWARKALQLNPHSNANYQLTARILWHLGRSEEAIATIKKNISLNPQASNNFSLLSRWSFQSGLPVDAVAYAAKEWELEPNNANKKWRLCLSLLQIWYWDKSDECTESLLEEHPDYYEAKKYQLELSRSPKLEAHIQQQIEKFPNAQYFKLQLVHYYGAIGKWKESIDILSGLYPELLTESPRVTDFNIWGARILGWSMMNTEQSSQGRLILENIITHIDQTRKLQAGGYSSGTDDVYALAALGKKEAALDRLQQAVENGWLFYSFFFFNKPGVNDLHKEPKFKQIRAVQQNKVQQFQRELNGLLSISFDSNTVIFHKNVAAM